MSKLSLNKKIYGIISIFILACVFISYIGISNMGSINDSLNGIVDNEAARIQYSLELKAIFESQIITEKNFILEETKEGMVKLGEAADKGNVEFEKKWKQFYDIVTENGKKELEEMKANYNDWWKNTLEIQKLSLAGDNKSAFKMSFGVQRDLRFKTEKIIQTLVERNIEMMKQASDATDVQYFAARKWMIILSCLAIFTGLFVAYIIVSSVSRAIDQVIENLTDNSAQVTSAAHQIASSSEELSQASTEQASSLEQTSSSIEELNSMVQKNAENAKETSVISTQSKANAEKGKIVVSEMISAINDINNSNNAIMQSIDDSNKKMGEIVEVINEISNKTKVINDIVFQTKLLSFNASVEAARAGEHGKGFAVVAEEVGNLAQMSGNAANEITSMLDSSVVKVQSIVHETKSRVDLLVVDGKKKVEIGTRIAKECGDVLEDIVVNINNVNEMAGEISEACHEQALGVTEITKAIGNLDQVTQTNSATSEEAAQAAEELSAQAESLRAVVQVLFETIKGSSGDSKMSEVKVKPRTIVKEHMNSKIIPLPKVKKVSATMSASPAKKVSGSDFIPSSEDKRFEDV